MADIRTSLMGISLNSPVILGASSLTHRIENVKKAADAGVGAIVIHSIFQEQIELDRLELDEELNIGSEIYPESLTYFPHMDSAGSREHIMLVEQIRSMVDIPLIGSLNATRVGEWVSYANQLQNAGCNALELNLYAVETNLSVSCIDIEKRSLDVIAAVKDVVSIPVSVKLSPFYTSIAGFVSEVVKAGADAVVLFNRFYQPFIDVNKQAIDIRIDLSRPEDTRLPLRWIAILSNAIKTDFVANSGVHSGADVVRHILAGACATQVVSALYQHGIDNIAEMNRQLADWMDIKGYNKIEEFRGKLSKGHIEGDAWAFERAQYISAILGHSK